MAAYDDFSAASVWECIPFTDMSCNWNCSSTHSEMTAPSELLLSNNHTEQGKSTSAIKLWLYWIYQSIIFKVYVRGSPVFSMIVQWCIFQRISSHKMVLNAMQHGFMLSVISEGINFGLRVLFCDYTYFAAWSNLLMIYLAASALRDKFLGLFIQNYFYAPLPGISSPVACHPDLIYCVVQCVISFMFEEWVMARWLANWPLLWVVKGVSEIQRFWVRNHAPPHEAICS